MNNEEAPKRLSIRNTGKGWFLRIGVVTDDFHPSDTSYIRGDVVSKQQEGIYAGLLSYFSRIQTSDGRIPLSQVMGALRKRNYGSSHD